MARPEQILVSIIMPAFNAERHIAESIRSVLGQTYAHWELIVVDDGSTDRTAEVVRSFAPIDNRIEYVFQRNGGQGSARNAGIKNSTGSMIAFLDADDLWVREKLELQVKKIIETKADVLFSDGYIFTGDDAADESTKFPTVSGRFNGEDMFDVLLTRNPIPILSALVRRGTLEEVGLFEEDRRYQNCEDYDLWLKLAGRGAVFYGMEERLVRYRRHPTAMTFDQTKIIKTLTSVVERHKRGDADDEMILEGLRTLYRNIIFALLEENRVAEARNCMKDFSALDHKGIVTLVQGGLIRLSPRWYNPISQHLLYRAEWHLKNLRRKSAAS